MKNITQTIHTNIKPLFLIMLFIAISNVSFAGNKTVKIKTSAICDMCKDRIELALSNVDGIKKSLLNVDTKIVLVKFDTNKISVEDIRKAISEAGYDADDVAANAKAYSVLPGCCKKGSSCDH